MAHGRELNLYWFRGGFQRVTRGGGIEHKFNRPDVAGPEFFFEFRAMLRSCRGLKFHGAHFDRRCIREGRDFKVGIES